MHGLSLKGTHETSGSTASVERNKMPEDGRRRKMCFAHYISFGPFKILFHAHI